LFEDIGRPSRATQATEEKDKWRWRNSRKTSEDFRNEKECHVRVPPSVRIPQREEASRPGYCEASRPGYRVEKKRHVRVTVKRHVRVTAYVESRNFGKLP
jgi:hypothetical protein